MLDELQTTLAELNKWMQAKEVAEAKIIELKTRTRELMKSNSLDDVVGGGLRAFYKRGATKYQLKELNELQVQAAIEEGILEQKPVLIKGHELEALTKGYVEQKVGDPQFTITKKK